MAGTLVNQGEVVMLEAFVNKTAPQDLQLRLFKNDYTPVETTTEADVVEADFTGYAPITLTPVNWVSLAGAPSQVTYAQQIFLSTAVQSALAYGYYFVQAISGKLVAAERFSDGPYSILLVGDPVKVSPKITQA